MRFINHHEIPGRVCHVGRLLAGELVGAYHDFVLRLEWPKVPLPDGCVVGLRFEKLAGQEEFLRQFLMPLLAKRGRHDDKNASLPFSPLLRNHEARLNGLAETNFVRDQRAFGEWGIEREKRRVHLVRIQIHLRARNRAGQLLKAVRRAAFRQLECEIFRVVVGQVHAIGAVRD